MSYLLCDLPEGVAAEHLLEEKGLLLTVVESLNHGSMNMRLQFQGLRFLSLVCSLRVSEEAQQARTAEARAARERAEECVDLRRLVAEANGKGVIDRVREDLSRSGYSHMASWAGALGWASLEKAKPKKPKSPPKAVEEVVSDAPQEDDPGGGGDDTPRSEAGADGL